jgi:hypothetical protein
LGEENYRNTVLFSFSLQLLGSYDWMAIGFGKVLAGFGALGYIQK